MKGTGARVVAVTGTVLLAGVFYILAYEPKGGGKPIIPTASVIERIGWSAYPNGLA